MEENRYLEDTCSWLFTIQGLYTNFGKTWRVEKENSQVRQKQCNADAYIIKRAKKAHVLRWGHITGVIIKLSLLVRLRVGAHYYNTTYTITYSDGSCDRFTNAFSLTNAIRLFSMRLKYNFTLESSNIVL